MTRFKNLRHSFSRYGFLYILFILAGTVLHAQDKSTELRGILYDSTNQKPVSFATRIHQSSNGLPCCAVSDNPETEHPGWFNSPLIRENLDPKRETTHHPLFDRFIRAIDSYNSIRQEETVYIHTDRGLYAPGDDEPSLVTSWLLSPEIKGKIYHLNSYLYPCAENTAAHIEALLLTQGWRDYTEMTVPPARKPVNRDLVTGNVESSSYVVIETHGVRAHEARILVG